MAGRMQ